MKSTDQEFREMALDAALRQVQGLSVPAINPDIVVRNAEVYLAFLRGDKTAPAKRKKLR